MLKLLPGRSLPQRRAVLLGASNVTRGISTIVETARRNLGRRLHVAAAFGHGRSYGIESRMLGRSLPGIAGCGLWQDLRHAPPLPTFALLTDVGNDLLYGVGERRIAAWVEQCLDSLARLEARVVVTELPLENLDRLSERRFAWMRRILFPGRRVSLDEIVDRAARLNQRLVTLADEHGARLIRPRASWYGIDPIHIKLSHWRFAWREILSPWSDDAEKFSPARGSLPRWIYLRRVRPQRRCVFGFSQYREQPAGRLAGGTVIAYY